MPPLRVQKRTSSGPAKPAFVAQFPVPSTVIPTKTGSPARTPQKSPLKQRIGITKAQKQALIDNLQLEITERARKLRAQYALQARGLRSRLEMRVNRIPQALRQAKMGELLVKYTEKATDTSTGEATNMPLPSSDTRKRTALRISPDKAAPIAVASHRSPLAPRSKGLKRSSDETNDADKENANAVLPLPKKRTKTVAQNTANQRVTRVASRRIQPSTVLSPKSNNSRTLPRPPVKAPSAPPSPAKSGLARPISPVKPAVSVSIPAVSFAETAETTKPKRTNSRQSQKNAAPPAPSKARVTRGKRAAPAPGTGTAEVAVDARGRAVSNSTSTSDSSAGTTIVTKAQNAPVPRRGLTSRMAGISAVGKKVAAAAAGKKDAPSAGGRVLRKRT